MKYLIIIALIISGCGGGETDKLSNEVNTSSNVIITPKIIPVDNSYFLLLSSINEIWTGSNSLKGGVSRFSASGELLARIETGTATVGLAEDDYGYIWIAEFNNNSISKIDPSINEVVSTIQTGINPYGIIYDGGYIYATIQQEYEVIKIDINTNKIVDKITVGGAPHNMIVADGKLFVANEWSSDITVIDTSSFIVVKTVNTMIGRLVNVLIDSFGKIWATGYADNSVFIIDETVDRIPVSHAVGLIKYNDKILVSSAWNNIIVELNEAGKITRKAQIAGASTIRNILKVENKIWVAGYLSDKIYIIEW